LLVVVALIAVASTSVSLSMRDSIESALQRDADRLAVLLETGRAQARANGQTVVWRTRHDGFAFEGLSAPGLPQKWLSETTQVTPDLEVILGPEPLIEPQALALSNRQFPGKTVWVVTDGLRPFKAQNSPSQP
jgi:general secretion pathway protein H